MNQSDIEDALERGVCSRCQRDCVGTGCGVTPSDATCVNRRCDWRPPTLAEQVRRILALAAPTAKGGTEDWRDDPSADERWNAGLDFGMQQLCAKLGVDPQDVSWDAATETVDGDVRSVIGNILTQWAGDEWQDAPARLASPPPPAGAAGGGSGDLGALSAGAIPEGWALMPLKPTATMVYMGCEGIIASTKVVERLYEYMIAHRPDAPALHAAPTPDLGAQGEPVAWAYEYMGVLGRWTPFLSRNRPKSADHIRSVAPLFRQAPAAPRTGSGVSAEAIPTGIYYSVEHDNFYSIEANRGRGHTFWRQWRERRQEFPKSREEAIALFAQAPRDGGETQGGWQAGGEAMREAAAAHLRAVADAMEANCRGDLGTMFAAPSASDIRRQAKRIAELEIPTPPSGVETIRQDSEGATGA